MTLLKVADPDWKRLHRIADGLAPELSRRLTTILNSLSSQIPTASLVDLIEDGLLDKVLAETKLQMPDATALKQVLGQIVEESGRIALEPFDLRFDIINERSVRWLDTYTADLIAGVNRETQKAVTQIVQRGFLEGLPPRVQAIAIEQTVGNKWQDGKAVFNYLAGLQEAGVSERRQRELAARYANRLRRQRAITIAQTETMRASNMGQQLAWEAAQDAGLFEAGTMSKEWIATEDDRTCPRCMGLDGSVVLLGDQYREDAATAPKSVTVTTLTPPLHPRCRCAMGLVENLSEETASLSV